MTTSLTDREPDLPQVLPSSASADDSDAPLRHDVRSLGDRLGDILNRHGEPGLFDLVEQVRMLAKRWHGEPAAAAELTKLLQSQPSAKLRELVRAFTCYFDLANLAEDRHRIRVLRDRERSLHPKPRSESIGAAINTLSQDQQLTAQQVQSLLDKLQIELVFTAHPTEAKRRTVRKTLRRIREDLIEREDPRLLPRELDEIEQRIQADLDCYWETETVRPRRPTVIEEVRRNLYLIDSLWLVAPRLYRGLRGALEQAYPDHEFQTPVFLRFGSWIGGDRDGNPFVTPQVTAETLKLMRQRTLERHLIDCRRMQTILTISSKQHEVSPQLRDALNEARRRWPQTDARVKALHAYEVYRRWFEIIRFRLEQTALADPFTALPPGAYADARALRDDLQLVVDSLDANDHHHLAGGELQDWMDRLAVFGLHFARLDIREDSRLLHRIIGELAAAMNLVATAADYQAMAETDKQKLLLSRPTHDQTTLIDVESLSEDARKTHDLFLLVHRAAASYGPEIFGALVISMTHQPSDALTMLWLSRFAAASVSDEEPCLRLPIAPLFETIDDLSRASDILLPMWDAPAYAEHLEACDKAQICMIGYSDSAKDGGYLSANWQLFDAQSRLAELAKSRGARLMLFHGRGGSLGRGGGPAARGIQSLPAGAVDGRMRMTEQGEVIADRYDDPEIAYRHLEQVTWATMLVTAGHAPPPQQPWIDAITLASNASLTKYRELIAEPGFIQYFGQATPIDIIETLPIGSRPSRRGGKRQLSALRAIPYTFAWTQSRHLVTAYYGMGTGLEAARQARGDWSLLQEMYKQWPFFRGVIDNAQLGLVKCDMTVADRYADLVSDSAVGRRILSLIQDEFEASRAAVLAITQQDALLANTPWLQRSVQVRNPYVDALNFVQIELMRRLRDQQDRDDQIPRGDVHLEANIASEIHGELTSLNEALRLSIQGIAAGLRTTG